MWGKTWLACFNMPAKKLSEPLNKYPMLMVPAVLPLPSCTWRASSSHSFKMRRAPLRQTSPAGVRETPLFLRISSGQPNSRSSSAMARLSAGWVTKQRLAARVRFPSSAAAAK